MYRFAMVLALVTLALVLHTSPAHAQGVVVGEFTSAVDGGPRERGTISVNVHGVVSSCVQDGCTVLGIDPNRATQDTLAEWIKGVGPAKAARIIAHREAAGPFTSCAQFEDVPGIGPVLGGRFCAVAVFIK